MFNTDKKLRRHNINYKTFYIKKKSCPRDNTKHFLILFIRKIATYSYKVIFLRRYKQYLQIDIIYNIQSDVICNNMAMWLHR